MQSKGMLVIISGPSGSGKGTVVRKLAESDKYALSVSMTTRPPRRGEEDGREYFFCTPDEFIFAREAGELLEHAQFCGNYYGTPRTYVEDRIDGGKAVVLEIDVNGALQVRDKFPDAVLIFLIPPTMDILEQRLIGRNTEDKETIEDRLRRAREEVTLIGRYDYLVINDEVDAAVADIRTIVRAESHRPKRNGAMISSFKSR